MSLKVFQNFVKSSNRGILLLRPVTSKVKENDCQYQALHTESINEKSFSFAEAFRANFKPVFRTHEENPKNHQLKHEGLFYTIDQPSFEKLALDWSYGELKIQAKTFQEACLMVRQPALEIIHAMNHINYNHPIPKFVLYGDDGCGKTMTLLHLMHYGLKNGFCVLQTPWPLHWIEWNTEVSISTHKPQRIDIPGEAKRMLMEFLRINGNIMDNFVTQFRYEWTKREATEIGTPIKDLINFGLTRVKFADDVYGALLKEIKKLASDKQLKVLVAIDGINAYFCDSHYKVSKSIFKDTLQRKEKNEFIKASDISLIDNYRKLLQTDMVNSVCVCTVDYNLIPKEKRIINTPRHLLGKEGFEFMDPFIPLHVPNYSNKEVHSCLEYFIERHWIINPKGRTEEGRKQLIFLSNKNPKTLYKVCEAW